MLSKGMLEEKKRSWFRRHWVISSILGFFLLLIIIGIFQGVKEGASGNAVNSGNSLTTDVWSKTSDYTLDDCLEICNKYCIQAQTEVCQGSCYDYGKSSNSLDKYINTVKNVTENLIC